jgi:23S rRNA pseudouridine1911/1915/1917 synthase
MTGDPTLVFRVTRAEQGARLDSFLHARIPWRSRSNLKALIEAGLVQVNGKRAKPASRLSRGDRVVTPIRDPRPLARQALDCALPVLLADPAFLVIDKPPFLATHATGRHLRTNVVSALRGQFGEPVPKPVHRLDLETSGVLLCARTPSAHRTLSLQFERREVSKRYLAIVVGAPAQASGRLEGALERHRASRVRIRMRAGGTGGAPARTDYRTLKRWRGFSLVELAPATGRQHQIRAQLEAAGHPVVGDKIYGPDEGHFLAKLEGELPPEARARLLLDRHALHASAIGFRHPESGAAVRVSSPLPADLSAFIEALEAGTVGGGGVAQPPCGGGILPAR